MSAKINPNSVQQQLLAPLASLALLLALSGFACAQDQLPETGAEKEEASKEKASWLDSSHDYVTNRADRFAVWVDDFFGANDSDLESAHSLLRLQIENEWQGIEESDVNLRLRGKLHLPQIDKRLSLIFSDGIGPDEDDRSVQNILNDRNQRTDVALQYNLQEEDRSRFDMRLSLRSLTNLKVAARYRYTYPFLENYAARFTETLYYLSDDGLGSATQLKIDRLLAEDRQISWYNYFRYSEISHGVEWGSDLSFSRRLDDKRAIEYIAGISGETRPTARTTKYVVGVLYRQNFLRPWLYWEIEPTYVWERNLDQPAWKSGPEITLRLEIKLEHENRSATNKNATERTKDDG